MGATGAHLRRLGGWSACGDDLLSVFEISGAVPPAHRSDEFGVGVVPVHLGWLGTHPHHPPLRARKSGADTRT